ncbi:MAG: DUF3086 domain-containing protein [Pelatocladus maniniholoensis HA4357-MV3]|jgi:hypothetical protein|uniref:DUF3086 domain-containing protein n=1 Tax=Pelatocladus maniniholoensis HA4357-MV3 TaxID=1117104 RepID=A0A9E3LTP2_9NOST|nr:DUF3086 domain-containing protein [Pelatocladus maniniholoensis HA4357-MV3]BAZ67577.1 hypothetical protein NIES4106_23320 [Fischerella sp. NIES-4106]
MYPEEYQNQQPTDESLQSIDEKSPILTNGENENLAVEAVSEATMQNSTEDTEQNQNHLTANSQANNSNDEFAVQRQEKITTFGSENQPEIQAKQQQLAELQEQKQALKAEIANLQASYKTLQAQMNQTQIAMGNFVQETLFGLEQRKNALQISVEQLERRQERIRNEMRTTFAGASQELAIRVQGFKDYLAGSLQDLAIAAEQLQLVPASKPEPEKVLIKEVRAAETELGTPQFTQQQFQDTNKQIRRLIDQYRTKPDYYGPAWQLRRTFEPVHAERVSSWFFNQGGRGALRTMGSRLQNILVASAVISILHKLYGDRIRSLVLANTPERLGEWRRGLQDCLGIGRPDFGPDRGVVLFESPEAVAQKAERLEKSKQLPLIIIDDSEEVISLALLQFPLWLAFAPDPKMMRSYEDDF